jgi:Flp pilus assembly protein TadG
MAMHALRTFLRDERAASLVEFSLVAPLLILLMCGMAEFANGMRQYHIMQKGVRDASRYVARVQMTGCTIPAAAITNAKALALTGRISGGTNLLSTWTDPNTITVTVSTCFNNTTDIYRGQANMPIIQVQANAPYVDLGLLDIIGLGSITLQVTNRQLWIGA